MNLKRLAEYLPVFLMILLAIILTVEFNANGKGLISSAILGSAIAVISIWLVFFSTHRVIMYLTRGAPFRIGDVVRVTAGEKAGRVGEVTRIVDGSPAIFVKLVETAESSEDQFFRWNQVTRRGLNKLAKN